MKINLMKNKNTEFGFSKCLDEEMELIGKITPLNDKDGFSEVEFKVNGVELNFENVMDVLMDNFEKCVLGEAKKWYIINMFQIYFLMLMRKYMIFKIK